MAISIETYFQHNYPSFERLPQIVRDGLLTLFKKLSHEDEINLFLQKNKHATAFDFIEAILEYFNIDININKNQLARIPAYGRVVIIANHPLGALDALALLNVVKDVRKDVKIVSSNFLSEFENIKDVLIPIENVRNKMERASVEAIYDALKKEQAVIIFPSGEVSRARPSGIQDTKWQKGFLRVASKMQAPILPIHIDAKNSKSFYFLSMLNKSLATATIPHEMFKYRDKNISFNIGKSIPYESYNLPSLPSMDVVKLLRKHFYLFAKKNKSIFKTHNAISLPENRQELKHELQNAQALGETKDGKKFISTPTKRRMLS